LPLDLGLPFLTGNHFTFQRWSTLPKEQPLEMRPRVDVSTMLAENIGRISLPVNMKEVKNLCRIGLSHPMVRQSNVPFIQLGVRNSRTGDH